MSWTSSLARTVLAALLAAVAPGLLLLTVAAAPAAPARGKLRPHTLEHFEEFCRRFIVLDNGRPFILEPFQKRILADFFAGATEVLVLLPKKNGKTTLLAALAIYHLIYTRDAACYIAASARDQAKILYDQACGFIERKDEHGKLLPQAVALQKRIMLRKGTREMRSRRDNGFIWVLSGDKDTADGVIPTLALVDELHRHKDNGQLYGVLHDGLGPRDGQIVTISTAGERLKSALGRIRRAALALPGVKREGVYTYARSPNRKFAMHEWALSPDDDREDMAIVKQANPLAGNTIEKLQARHDSPTMTPSRWARFGCGIWMQGEDAANSALDWARCGVHAQPLDRSLEIWLGLDLGWRWDTTAIVPFQVVDLERGRFGRPRILTPPRDGTSLSKEAVLTAILQWKVDGYTIRGVVFDRNAEGETIAQDLEGEHGLEVIEHSQDPAPMADACMGLTKAIGETRIEQPDDEDFTEHILACKAKTTSGEKWRYVAPEQNRGARKKGEQDSDDVEYIDAAIAAAMVHHTAMADANTEPPDPDLYRLELV